MTQYPQDLPREPQQPPSGQQPGGPMPPSGQPPPPYGQQPRGPMPPYGPPTPPYGAQPPFQPVPMTPADQRTWAIAAHLSPFLAVFVGFMSFLGPLIVYLVYKDRGPFIRHHSAEALNFQLTMWIGLLISIPLTLVFFLGVFTAGAIVLAMLICHILGAVAASEGRDFRYPFTIRFVS